MPKKERTWEDRQRSHMRTALRRAWRWSPHKNEAIRINRTGRGQYPCYVCGQTFKRPDVELDHVVPVVDPDRGDVDAVEFYKRMFCPLENLKTICIPCHEVKTKRENEERKAGRARRKKCS